MENHEFIGMLQKRRSIRRYKDTAVPETLVHQLLLAATAAPTAANCEPWEFVVIDAPDLLSKIQQSFVFARYNAPLAIVVCGNMDLAFKGPGREMWVQDCSAASQNMLLAAAHLGLGSVWIGIYPITGQVATLQKLIHAPDHVVPLNILYFGYPDEDKLPRSRLNEKRVYRNGYDPDRKHRKKNKPKIGHY